jgi:serine/threonine protein kinase, bacterial
VQRWVWDATKNSPIDVGRDLRNQVVLEAEQVSRFHAQLYWEGERWWLVNRGRNGTLVQGQFIQRLPLAPAGQFQCALGGPVLRWQHSLPYQQAAVPVFLPAFPPVAPSAGAGYEILGVLGEGGMATTYLVRSGGLVRSGAFSQEAGVEGLYVLKLLHPAMQQIPKAKQLFLREAQVLQRLSHPHIMIFLRSQINPIW